MSALEKAVGNLYLLAESIDDSHEPGELSISSLGGCLRRSAYMAAGTPMTDPDLSHPASYLGTWLHAKVIPLLRRQIRGARSEVPVVLTHAGLTLKGRTDLWLRREQAVFDLKTTRAYAIDRLRRDGVPEKVRTQVAGYAVALEQAGNVIERLAYGYLDRETGEIDCESEPFTDDLRKRVFERLEGISNAAVAPDFAERTERGPGLSIVCDGCAWLRQCWGPDARRGETGPQDQLLADSGGAEGALALYGRGMDLERRGKADKELARAMLQSTPKGAYGDWHLSWSVKAADWVPDPAAAVSRLREIGETVPMKPRAESRSIGVRPRAKGTP